MTPYYAELSADGVPTVRFEGRQSLRCLGISKNGIEGWDSTPAAKVTTTERGQGDGGHDIASGDILYASRTVSLRFTAVDLDREGLVTQLDALRRMVHRPVRLRVVDTDDTYCDGGYLTLTMDAKRHESWTEENTATIVFERPERLAAQGISFQLKAVENAIYPGLNWGDDNGGESKPTGLEYPMDYGDIITGNDNMGMIVNMGTSRSYPVYEVHGPFPHGVELVFPTQNGVLTYSQPIYETPLVLDTRTRTASIDRLDVSRNLTRRGWQTIPPGYGVQVVLATAGAGWVTVTNHDTYM
ncbi:hypothetical protein [Bifidobacterium animalis]|uniref:hypothetical protein n=1 Tax=Bifidobacterium animalis TaxID=28025 RepID=UPI003F90B2F7